MEDLEMVVNMKWMEKKKNSPWISKFLNDILKFINYPKFGDRISINYNKHMKKVKIT